MAGAPVSFVAQLLCDVEGGEVPILVLSHQECKLAESLSIVPAIDLIHCQDTLKVTTFAPA